LKKMTAATMFVRQYDTLLQEEVAERYAFELARVRPQTNDAVQRDTAQQEGRYRLKQWQVLQTEKLIERVFGVDVEVLRVITDEVTTVYGRLVELEAAARNRELLAPALATALDGDADPDRLEELNKVQKHINEGEVARRHYEALSLVFDSLLQEISYLPVSDLVVATSNIEVVR
jgi:transcriptional regulator of met regulon